MSDSSLKKARDELRKQFMDHSESIANNFQFMDADQLIRLRQAIDALDHAIDKGWATPTITRGAFSGSEAHIGHEAGRNIDGCAYIGNV